jgi:gamma-glutamyltranspeptidase/glutathione hydrolase
MKINRRGFVKAAAGVAAGGLVGSATTAAPRVGAAEEAERRRLIALARFGEKSPASGKKGMAITSHPLATRAAVDVLRAGGNACDAALAASITQTVVEPHMTTITGVLSLLYFDAKTGKTTYLNGGMNRPKAALPGFSAADLATGRGVAVPGWWAGFEAALERHGTKPKKEVMAAAIAYARDGFEIYPFLWGEIFVQLHKIGLTAAGREIYFRDGAVLAPGALLRQTKAARTLERLAEEGSRYFYRGEFAEKFCKVVKEAGGVVTREDLEAYRVRWQEPARGTYRGHEILASPPPDHGGSHVIEMLNLVELLDLPKLGPPTDSPETLLQMVRIHNSVYLEGARQNDPESHPLPLEMLLSKNYARMRFELLQMGHPKTDTAGAPPPGSNHVTVVDGAGNVATILHSCMSYPWSNGLFVEGVSICAAGAHFLRVMPRPGFRASAYVAPNILFKGGKPILASGSPSVGLLANIVQNTTNIVDFGIAIPESVKRPRFGGVSYTVPGASMIEVDIDEKIRKEVTDKDVSFEVVNPWNWHHGSFEGIFIDPETGVATACGDPRRCSMAEAV